MFGRKTLEIMLICIGDGMRDSLIILRVENLISPEIPLLGAFVSTAISIL